VRANREEPQETRATVLTVDELEQVERRLGDVGPWDDAARLIQTVHYLRTALVEIRQDAGPGAQVRSRDRASHALYPTKGLTKWKYGPR
jgi:hypothetical protein